MQKKRIITTSKEIGKRIKNRRRELGISQEELAVVLGVTYQQVQRYESGANKLNVENIQTIADVLSAPVSYFFTTDLPSISQGKPSPRLSPEESTLLKHFKKVKDGASKSTVLQVVKLATKRRE